MGDKHRITEGQIEMNIKENLEYADVLCELASDEVANKMVVPMEGGMGMVETRAWLGRVKQMLLEEGFMDAQLQIQKPNQSFGLIKRIADIWEMHVRGFYDGSLDAKIEISRDYIEHSNDRYSTSAINELIGLLNHYGIPFEITGEPTSLVSKIEAPNSVTEWRPLLGLGIVIGALLGMAYALEKDS